MKRFSDVHSGRCRENILHLVRMSALRLSLIITLQMHDLYLQSFLHWDKDFYAKTDQATKMLEMLRIYIDMTKRNLK